MREFTGKITQDELAGEIAYALRTYAQKPQPYENDGMANVEPISSFNGAYDFLKQELTTYRLSKQIEEDVSWLEFDDENVLTSGFPDYEKVLGFHTLDNGLSFLGFLIGGDWEEPIFLLVYYTGNILRAFIPKEGNSWNTDTMTAYGNDPEKDSENCKKLFGIETPRGILWNCQDILKEINEKFTFKDGPFTPPHRFEDIPY